MAVDQDLFHILDEDKGRVMFCSHCGAEVSRGARFCSACGQSTAGSATSLADESDSPANGWMGVKPRTWGARWVLYGLVVFVCMVLAGAIESRAYKGSPGEALEYFLFHADECAKTIRTPSSDRSEVSIKLCLRYMKNSLMDAMLSGDTFGTMLFNGIGLLLALFGFSVLIEWLKARGANRPMSFETALYVAAGLVVLGFLWTSFQAAL